MRTTLVPALALGALAAAGPLSAQAAPPLPKSHEFTSSLSFVNTSGNTSVTTSGLDDKLILRPGWRWVHTQTAGVVYGKNNGVIATETYRFGWKTEMAITSRIGVYGQGDFLRNRFAGIRAYYAANFGLSDQIFYAPNDQVSLEAGFGHVSQFNTTNSITDFFSARGALLYHHSFTATAYFDQSVEFLPNLADGNDLRINSASTLIAPISSHIGLKAGYTVRYDHQPQPGFKNTDALFTTGLQLTF